ncbi:MAG: hypothetical protein E7340_05005 [Clostridiales bacterium]|nr:hypothetical protein [Clostridiales bacterium]
MNSAKSYKISVLLTAFIMCIVAAFCSLTFSPVSAETKASDPSKYFGGGAVLSFDDDKLVAEMKESNELVIYNELVVEDMELVLEVPKDVAEFSVNFRSDAYAANGNMYTDETGKTKFKTSVSNLLTIKFSDTATEYSINDNAAAKVKGAPISVNDGVRLVKINVTVDANNLLVVNVNGLGNAVGQKGVDAIERIDKTTAVITFKLVDIADSGSNVQAVKLVSVDQKKTDGSGAYKQTFETDENGVIVKNAYPRVVVNDSYFIKNGDGKYNKLVMLANAQRTYSMSICSIMNRTQNISAFVTSNETDAWIANEEKPRVIAFGQADTGSQTSSFDVAMKDGDKIVSLETYNVTVIDEDTDKQAPIYVNDAAALNAYKQALSNIINIETTEDGKVINTSVALGTTPNLPSMRDLVYDAYTSYDELDLSLVYSNDDVDSSTTSSMKFKITTAGDYEYYAMFTDNAGNAMEKKDFRIQDEEDENVYVGGKYKDYIFKFAIEDNAPISIEKSEAKGVGFKGIKYKASKFNVQAEGCKTTYTLYYNEKVGAEKEDDGWVVIPAASKVTSESYSDNYGNTYESVKAVGYDGTLTFVPTKYGSYMIECVATSDYTTRTGSDYTILSVDEVNSNPTFVEVPNYWLRDNVWSVVFLSVGTLCLIGIIVLLFIKPKDETGSN